MKEGIQISFEELRLKTGFKPRRPADMPVSTDVPLLILTVAPDYEESDKDFVENNLRLCVEFLERVQEEYEKHLNSEA